MKLFILLAALSFGSYDTKIYNRTNYDISVINQSLEFMDIGNFTVYIDYMPELKHRPDVSVISDNMNGFVISVTKNTYRIFIKKGLDNYKSVLIHELIHIYQMEKGRLKYDSEGFVYWLGKKYNPNKIRHKKRPWEKDAFEKQKNLVFYLKQKGVF